MEPDETGSRDLILAHIREVLADGSREHAHYILGWLAQLVQHPAVKPDVVIVFQGGKGAGKDTLAKVMYRIVGRRHVAHIIRSDLLTQRFNAHFEQALLAHVEESYWAGSRSDKGALQAMITAPTTTLERKGIDPIVIDSYVRLLMTTNEDWAVPASADERRYAVFNVSDKRIGDRQYFRALYAEIDGVGPAAFLHFLLNFDLSDFEVRDVPKTGALADQKIASLRGFHRWWFDILHDGVLEAEGLDLTDWDTGYIYVDRQVLRGGYEEFIRSHRHQGEAVSAQRFGKLLREVLPSLEETRPRSGEGQRH